MAKRHDVLGVTGADTVVGTGVKLRGNLQSEGDIAVDGHITGNIRATGSVNVGVNASLKSDIEAIDVLISGSLLGNIIAEDNVTLGETAYVIGNIACQRLSIAQGAIFIGQIKMPEEHPVTTSHNDIPDEIEVEPGDTTEA